ncbi:MAG: DNA repair protein RecO [Bdellovibrionota bacterium]
MITNEKVIILRKTKFGESDLILSFLDSSGQVHSVMAKAALKSKKRFGGGVLEPLHYVNFTFKKKDHFKESEKLPLLSEAQLIYDFPKIRADYERLTLGLHIVKTVSTVIREGDLAHKGLFDLVGNSLRAVESSGNLRALKLHFEVKFLSLQGVIATNAETEDLLKLPLKEHEKIDFSSMKWSAIARQVDHALENFVG